MLGVGGDTFGDQQKPLAIEVDDRHLELAQRLVHCVVRVLAPGVMLSFVTDQLAVYGKALLGHFGCWVRRTGNQSGQVLRRWMLETATVRASEGAASTAQDRANEHRGGVRHNRSGAKGTDGSRLGENPRRFF
jgi:hypothetical protein